MHRSTAPLSEKRSMDPHDEEILPGLHSNTTQPRSQKCCRRLIHLKHSSISLVNNKITSTRSLLNCIYGLIAKKR